MFVKHHNRKKIGTEYFFIHVSLTWVFNYVKPLDFTKETNKYVNNKRALLLDPSLYLHFSNEINDLVMYPEVFGTYHYLHDKFSQRDCNALLLYDKLLMFIYVR